MHFAPVDLAVAWEVGSRKATGFFPLPYKKQQLETLTTRKPLPHSGWKQPTEKMIAMISIYCATASEREKETGK